MNQNMTMLILSCDKFSDLWDGHVSLLEKNWPDRQMAAYLVTDKPTINKYNTVTVLSAGENVEWSDRLLFALKQIHTEYVFITLDDYFLIKPVSCKKIQNLIKIMQEHNLDYMRLYKRPVRATKETIPGCKGINYIDTTSKYSVNLYSAIWKRDFLMAMTDESLNAWQFEVKMPKKATAYGAKCAVSHNNEFVILDVVRKGKLLHKSAKYLRQHPELYSGNRETNSWGYEIRLGIKTMVGRHTPMPVYNAIRSIMKKVGYKFISDQE